MIHDLPQPHLTSEEARVVKGIIQKQEQERRRSIDATSPVSPKLLSPLASTTNGHVSLEGTVKDLSNLSLASSVSSPIQPAKGYRIDIDFSVMANHANLTALPRVPNANLQMTDVDVVATPRAPGSIPSFIQTPAPLLMARINKVQCLTPPDALKRTLAVEFGFEDDVNYAPGDAFGIWAPNNEALVLGVLSALNVSDTAASKTVKLHGQGNTAGEAIERVEIMVFALVVDLVSHVFDRNPIASSACGVCDTAGHFPLLCRLDYTTQEGQHQTIC
jgi:methionine synthase reductase